MASIDIEKDLFSCRQKQDFVVITFKEGAKFLFTSVYYKNEMMSLLKTIENLPEIKGLAVIFSTQYKGDLEYKRLISQLIEGKPHEGKKQTTVTFKESVCQFLENAINYPLPIVAGMNGDIGPDSFGLSLAYESRIATKNASFINPNIRLGLPPSAVLSYFLIQNLGPLKTMDLLLSKTEFKSETLDELGLITKFVTEQELENSCLQKLKELSEMPRHAVMETRRLIQPDIDEIQKYIDANMESTLKSLYIMKNKELTE